MAIYYKRDIEKRLQALEEHYEKLRTVLQGRKAPEAMAEQFGIDREAFVESRVCVDFAGVLIQAGSLQIGAGRHQGAQRCR